MARAVERVDRNGVGLIPIDGVQVKRDDDAMIASVTGLDRNKLAFSTQRVAVEVAVDISRSCMSGCPCVIEIILPCEAGRQVDVHSQTITLVQLHCVTVAPGYSTCRRIIAAVCAVKHAC